MQTFEPVPKLQQRRMPDVEAERVVPSCIGSEDLAAAWLFHLGEESTLWDFSGEENHGDINGPVWTDEEAMTWGLDFDGSDDWVDLPDIGVTGDQTMFVWAVSDVADGTYDKLVGHSGMKIYNSDADLWEVRFSNATSPWATGPAVTTGEIVSLAATFDESASTGYIYVDGTQEDSTSTDSITTGNFELCYDTGADGQYFDGRVFWLLYFTRLLSDAEISDLHSETKPLFG